MIGGGVALLNVFIVAQLMFVSTSHDLKLLIALMVFSAIVTMFFSLLAASAIAGRIGRITAAIRTLAAGSYGPALDVSGGNWSSRRRMRSPSKCAFSSPSSARSGASATW